jgi:hypothetical protein
MRTKYIAQTVTPQWNEEMAILVAYPFTNDPKVGLPTHQRGDPTTQIRPLGSTCA